MAEMPNGAMDQAKPGLDKMERAPTDVVVTGMGIVSPIGIGVSDFRQRMFAGDSGVVDIRGTFAASNFPIRAAGMVPRATLGQPAILAHLDAKQTRGSWRMAGIATEEAIQSIPAGQKVDAIVFGSLDGRSFDLVKDSFRAPISGELEWDKLLPESSLAVVNRVLEHHGHGCVDERNVISINNVCSSANQAIGIAFQRIRSGQWERTVVGGVMAFHDESMFMNFCMLGAVSVADVPAAEASRPFSGDRSGVVLGEGAATLVLESRERAEGRGAMILGSVKGYAATADAYRLTDGRPDGKAVIGAMLRAIEGSGLKRENISAISAHGTSTRLNDRVETLAIKQLFGPLAYGIPVVSLKSQIGHSIVAAAALQAVATLVMLSEQRLAPTINFGIPDQDCDLDYVPNHSRPAVLEAILSNSFGFGGQNACVVFERASGATR
jgi:3-oxoacyl-[acyl-carrier-protein] synthase II